MDQNRDYLSFALSEIDRFIETEGFEATMDLAVNGIFPVSHQLSRSSEKD